MPPIHTFLMVNLLWTEKLHNESTFWLILIFLLFTHKLQISIRITKLNKADHGDHSHVCSILCSVNALFTAQLNNSTQKSLVWWNDTVQNLKVDLGMTPP